MLLALPCATFQIRRELPTIEAATAGGSDTSRVACRAPHRRGVALLLREHVVGGGEPKPFRTHRRDRTITLSGAAGEAEPSLGTRLATVQVARHSHDDTFLKTRTINDADAAALQKARFASAGTRALGIRTLSSFRVVFRRDSSDPSHCDFRSLRVPPAWKVPH